ncbi:MAG: hypothetical protein QG635_928 [Bacteroidota bacterium]|nr:hypothetical protein [Bacteroidota bacterium]
MKTIKLMAIMMAAISYFVYAQNATQEFKKYYSENNYDKASAFIADAIMENNKDVNFILICGDVYFELEKYQQALDIYKKADDVNSNVPKIMRKIGKAYSYLGEHLKAIEVLKKAVKKDDKDIYTRLELAQAFIKADSLSQAELEITRAKEINDKVPDAYIALGDLYFAQRVYELAKNNYEEALSLNENLTDARVKLATSYYWLANREYDQTLADELFNRSLKEWETVTKKDPNNVRAYFEAGKIFFYGRQYEKAVNYLKHFVELRPSGSLGRWFLAQCYYALNKCDSAEQHLVIAGNEIDSVKVKTKFLLANCYIENKEWIKAVEKFEEIRKTDTLSEEDLRRYGTAALNTGDSAKAFNIYEETINRFPDKSCQLMYSLGVMYFSKNRHDDAVRLFEKRLATTDCNGDREARIYFFIGLSKLFAQRAPEAKPAALDSSKAALLKCLELDSTMLNARIYLADVYINLKDEKLGEQEYFSIMEKAKADTAAFGKDFKQAAQKICNLKLDQKKFNDVIKYATIWTDVYQDDSLAFLYLAVGYQGIVDKDNACKNYKKVLKLDPKNNVAKKNSALLECE